MSEWNCPGCGAGSPSSTARRMAGPIRVHLAAAKASQSASYRLDERAHLQKNGSVRVMRQELEHEARLIEAEIDRSKFRSRLKASKQDLAIGAVTSTITGGVPIAPAAKTGSLLYDAMWGRGRQRDRASVLQHYLLFSPSAPN